MVTVSTTLVRVAIAILAAWAPAWSQNKPRPAALVNRLPTHVGRYAEKLGDRARAAGKERMTITGQLTRATGTEQAVVIWEAPGSFRFDHGSGQGAKTTLFSVADGRPAQGNVEADELDALESLVADSADSFFYALEAGATLRTLGTRFRADDGKAANYKGPWYDIFEEVQQLRYRGPASSRAKQFFFDSDTGLLVRVRYMPAAGVLAETLTGWQVLNGQPVPASIERKENGKRVFLFQASAASFGPAAADGAFQRLR